MKKLMNCVMVLVLCFAFVLPVAAEEPFVPSISYKGAPEIVPNENGEYGFLLTSDSRDALSGIGSGCLVITPLSEVEESEVIPEAEKEWIFDVYQKLLDKSIEIPYGDEFKGMNMVIRELFDLRLICDDGHIDEINKDGVVLEVTLDLGIGKDENVSIMVYIDDEWVPAASAINNGDGTMTIAFEKLGLVAISVPSGVTEVEETDGFNLTYIIILIICAVVAAAAALATHMFLKRRRKAKNK